MSRIRLAARWAAKWAVLFVLSFVVIQFLQRRGTETVGSGNGVRMEQVALTGLVPAVAASDVASGTCSVSRRLPDGTGMVDMRFPSGKGEIRQASVRLDASNTPLSYTELRHTAAAITSIAIDVAAGTGGMTNVTEGGARVTIGQGTAHEALQSEALGSPGRRIEKMLARCGQPIATN